MFRSDLVLETAPAALAITTAELKEQVNYTASDRDAYFDRLVATAIALVDGNGVLGRAMITQSWAQWLPPSPGRARLLMGPFRALSSVEYYDTDGALQTATASDFEVIGTPDRSEIRPKDGFSWPETDSRPDAIKTVYTAGYGDAASDVPQSIRHAMLLLGAHWFENREDVSDISMSKVPMAFDALIEAHRVGWYG